VIEQSAAERVKTSIGAGLQNGSVARFMAEEQRAVAKLQQISLFDRQGKIASWGAKIRADNLELKERFGEVKIVGEPFLVSPKTKDEGEGP